jgi:two-component system response regulator MprA
MSLESRILVVDDDRILCKILGAALSQQGFQVSSAHDGEEGLEAVEAFNPDLIVLDIMMPKMDGYEFCRRLRSDPSAPDIPILVLTALGDISLLRESQTDPDIQVDEFLTKPIRVGTLLERVNAMLWLNEPVS